MDYLVLMYLIFLPTRLGLMEVVASTYLKVNCADTGTSVHSEHSNLKPTYQYLTGEQ